MKIHLKRLNFDFKRILCNRQPFMPKIDLRVKLPP